MNDNAKKFTSSKAIKTVLMSRRNSCLNDLIISQDYELLRWVWVLNTVINAVVCFLEYH